MGGLIIIGAGWVGVMEGSGLHPIHLHLAQKQIVFVPLYFSIDHYLPFVSVPLPNSPPGCESGRLQVASCGVGVRWNGSSLLRGLVSPTSIPSKISGSPTQVVPPELNENHPVTAVALRIPWRSSDHEVIGRSPAPE